MSDTRHVIHRATPKSRPRDAPRLEWLLGVFGLLLLGSAVSFLIREGLIQDERPGAVSVTVTETRKAGSAYVVRFTVHNNGSQTLSHLHLTARLTEGSGQVESGQAFIDYLPGHSQREGGIYLKHDPGRYALEIRPEGYMTP